MHWSNYSTTVKFTGKLTLYNKHHQPDLLKMSWWCLLYKYILSTYVNKGYSDFRHQSIDSSFIPNKSCVLFRRLKYNKHYRNKKGAKIHTVVDAFGVPLTILVTNGNVSDTTMLIPYVTSMYVDTQKRSKNNIS